MGGQCLLVYVALPFPLSPAAVVFRPPCCGQPLRRCRPRRLLGRRPGPRLSFLCTSDTPSSGTIHIRESESKQHASDDGTDRTEREREIEKREEKRRESKRVRARVCVTVCRERGGREGGKSREGEERAVAAWGVSWATTVLSLPACSLSPLNPPLTFAHSNFNACGFFLGAPLCA